MENTDYYIPTIDEFEEGFEFEYYGDRIGSSPWHKGIYDKVWSKAAIMYRLKNNLIRVKK